MNGFQLLQDGFIKLDVDAVQIFLQLGEGSGTDNIAGHERARVDKRQSQLRGTQTMALRQIHVGTGCCFCRCAAVSAETFKQGQAGSGRALAEIISGRAPPIDFAFQGV